MVGFTRRLATVLIGMALVGLGVASIGWAHTPDASHSTVALGDGGGNDGPPTCCPI